MRYGEYIVEVERNWEVNLAPKQASFSGVATALIRIFLNCNSISHSAQPAAAAIPERERENCQNLMQARIEKKAISIFDRVNKRL